MKTEFDAFNNPTVDDFLKVLDTAAEIREFGEDATKILASEDAKGQFVDRALKIARSKGDNNTSREDIELALTKINERSYAFKEPKHDFSYYTSLAWVKRDAIRRKVLIPTATVAAGVLAVCLAVTGIAAGAKKVAEGKVETKIEQGYQTKEKLDIVIGNLMKNKGELQDASDFNAALNKATFLLENTNNFFVQYCPKGTANEAVTSNNYRQAESKFINANSLLDEANSNIERASGIIKTERALKATKENLEETIRQIHSERKAPSSMLAKAETEYTEGLSDIKTRNLTDAETHQYNLINIKDGIKILISLPKDIDREYNGAMKIAVEDNAIDLLKSIYRDAQMYIQADRASDLQTAYSRLKNIEEILNQDIVIRIVDEEGQNTGNIRDDSRKYIIVRAIDKNTGKIIPQDISNIENSGKIDRVDIWGEEVSDEVFERVKDDKRDDSVVNDNIFGKKERGYLSLNITFPGVTRKSQITKWEVVYSN
ncbi:MAG: DUF6384 family protein [Candidatus Woesearchaeota archaeon]|jgi:hypothetical protein